MSRIFITAACAFSLLGPAAFAQSSMGSSMGNTMSPSGNAMSSATMNKPSDSMAKPKTDSGMSNGMAPSGAMGNAMNHPSNAQ